MIKHRNKTVLAYQKPLMQKNILKKFRTIVSEVSSFMDNPVWKQSKRTVFAEKLNSQHSAFYHFLKINSSKHNYIMSFLAKTIYKYSNSDNPSRARDLKASARVVTP